MGMSLTYNDKKFPRHLFAFKKLLFLQKKRDYLWQRFTNQALKKKMAAPNC